MHNKLVNVGILGVGSSLPEKVLTNFDLEKMVETSDEWIVQRTGISERRVLENNQPAYELGVEAAQRAVEDAGLKTEDIDLILVSTNSPDYLVPSTACIIQGKIGAKNAAAFDLNAACAGFAYGLTVANQFISTGYYKHVLVMGCEGLSKVTDWEDRNTCILFSDGAGAVVLGPVEEGYGILTTCIGADGTQSDKATLPFTHISDEDLEKRKHENKNVLWMNGGAIMKFAVRIIGHATNRVLEEAKLSLDDIKYIVPHQANIRIMEGAANNLGISTEKIYENIKMNGNSSSASIPIALDAMNKKGVLEKGDNLVLVGFGGGLTWGAAIVKWSK